MKKLVRLIALLMCCISADVYAYDIAVENADGVTIYYNYINDKKELEVTYRTTNYNSYSGSVKIPEEVTYENQSRKVTSIGYNAFRSCSGLISVTIPNSVTSIRSFAFSYCSLLASISIPEGVTSIGEGAFTDCSRLTSVHILDLSAWFGITFGNSTSNPLYFAHHLFMNGEEIKDLVISGCVTSIGNYAFIGCRGLTSVTIGTSVTNIGASAFSGCYHLNTITCLGEVPPFNCERNFLCSTSYARDEYDVYNYAVLHVPMGSGELYASSYDWWYFKKIKEDMEMDGKVYYANLTVKQGSTGFTRQAVKASEKYTLFIGSLNDNKVNAVSFNGVDVTDEVVDGYYTTPEVKTESVLSISYETSVNAITLPQLPNVRVLGHNGEIQITNIDEPSDIQVYSCDGKLIDSRAATFGSTHITVPTDQLYVVKVKNRTFKIAM